jgi:hypothetical protein
MAVGGAVPLLARDSVHALTSTEAVIPSEAEVGQLVVAVGAAVVPDAGPAGHHTKYQSTPSISPSHGAEPATSLPTLFDLEFSRSSLAQVLTLRTSI